MQGDKIFVEQRERPTRGNRPGDAHGTKRYFTITKMVNTVARSIGEEITAGDIRELVRGGATVTITAPKE